ncbi:MAG: endonuclease/exonuclease/phosphatase family protein, partial [Pseudomonadota bacterium]
CEEIEVERWRNDCLYLDWNEDTLAFKLSVVADAILQVDDGRGPDVVALQEIENRAILERLRTDYLESAGYGPSILIEGQDNRGIDVAFLTRLPLIGEATLHAIEFPGFPERASDTRGILEAHFELPDGERLAGFAVHFPAPFHPIEMREAAYDHLKRLLHSLPEDQPAFAAGDFNTPKREVENTTIFADRVRPSWIVAHELGCGDCRGTNYWATGDSWSFLDMILYSPSRGENTTWGISADSVRIANRTSQQMRPDGRPRRFSAEPLAGVSDHWPLILTLEKYKNKSL